MSILTPPSEAVGASPSAVAQAVIPKSFPNGDPDAPLNPAGVRNTDSCLPVHATGEVVHNYTTVEPAPGDIAFRWISGSLCPATNKDPRIQVVAYNEDTYILRENPCVHWEAPFTYLLFGNQGALLIDTGATPEADWYPLRKTVDAIVRRWCDIRRRKTIPLTVVLTSGEDIAQNQGLGQFAGRADTHLSPIDFKARLAFHKLTEWPHSPAQIDLGGRVIDVIPTPGAHKDGVTFYDRYTRNLFTGDLLYPGRIEIANDRDYVQSLEKLKAWTGAHPVKWLLGSHVTMTFAPGRAYPRFATYRAFEHVLQLEATAIDEALAHSREVIGKQQVVFLTDFILLNRVGPDEQVYRTPPNLPYVPVPFWIS